MDIFSNHLVRAEIELCKKNLVIAAQSYLPKIQEQIEPAIEKAFNDLMAGKFLEEQVDRAVKAALNKEIETYVSSLIYENLAIIRRRLQDQIRKDLRT